MLHSKSFDTNRRGAEGGLPSSDKNDEGDSTYLRINFQTFGPLAGKKKSCLLKIRMPSSFFLSQGLRLVDWDGKITVPILDCRKHVIAILAGSPNDRKWDAVHKAGADEVEAWIPPPSQIKSRSRLMVGLSGPSILGSG